jgi:hypothetical protein
MTAATARFPAVGGSGDPAAPARTVLQGRLDAVIAEQDDRARIAHAGTGPAVDEVRDSLESTRHLRLAVDLLEEILDDLGLLIRLV